MPDPKATRKREIERAREAEERIAAANAQYLWQVDPLRYIWQTFVASRMRYSPIPSPSRIGSRAGRGARPKFAVVGSPCSGVRDLFDTIAQHPQIALPVCRELFHTSDERFMLGQFPDATRVTKAGQVTGYREVLHYNIGAVALAPAFAEGLLAVVAVREPVSRAIAHFRYDRSLRGALSKDPHWKAVPGLEATLRRELELIARGFSPDGRVEGDGTGYLPNGVYVDYVRSLMTRLGGKSVIAVDYNQLRAGAQEVFDALGLEHCDVDPPVVEDAPEIDVGLKERLRDYYRPFVFELESVLGRDLGWGY